MVVEDNTDSKMSSSTFGLPLGSLVPKAQLRRSLGKKWKSHFQRANRNRVRVCVGESYTVKDVDGNAGSVRCPRGGGGQSRIHLGLLVVLFVMALSYSVVNLYQSSPVLYVLQLNRAAYKYKPEVVSSKENSKKTTENFTTTKIPALTTTSFVPQETKNFWKKMLTKSTMFVEPAIPYCKLPSDLGPTFANKTEIELASIENKFPEVSRGGRYKPPNCTAKYRVAILIPYRGRPNHLATFLKHMHPFLMRQKLDYGIFVIEQQDSSPTPTPFNRAKLLNVGFVEANRASKEGWQCYIFHDVDMIPLDERNLYTCPRQPRHMCPHLDKFNYTFKYQDLFGGVSAMSHDQFLTVNGYSNKYWGWGGEDDDMSHRIKLLNLHITRYSKMPITRYIMLRHEDDEPNPIRYDLLASHGKNYQEDGLSSLKYELIKVVEHRLFTLVSVNIEEHSGFRDFVKALLGGQR